MAKITNQDIAKLAGVSPAVVSLAINGKPGVSEETRQKVLAIARQHNYCTGAASVQMLKERSSAYIASFYSTNAHLEDQAFYSEMSTAAMIACRELGYNLVSTYSSGENGLLNLPPAIRSGEVDGVLIFGDQDPSFYVELENLSIPFVILDCSRETKWPSVFVDYSQAAYDATKHLIDLGHRDIAYLSNGTLYDFNNQVLTGFQQATSDAGIALYPNRFQIKMGHANALEEGLEKAMAGANRPTAIFCAVDFYAIKVLRYLYEQGYRVPEDISVVSIDDVSISHLITPALTTVRIDRDRMIREGLEMLDAMRRGEKCESRMLSAPQLMVRQTTASVR